MIYVTHDQMEAMTMADRIVVMRAGKIEQIGTPLDIYDNPANSFVGGFIGSPSMNFVDGAVVEQGGAVALRDVSGTLWPLDDAARAYIGRAVQIGIRPEHVRIDAGGIPAEVTSIEPTGSETHLQVQVGGQSLVVVVHDRFAAEPGATIAIMADKARITLFDAETGVRLS
jgi:multiple sugar transport system ATP-binding protein